jgi:hypothetical protein
MNRRHVWVVLENGAPWQGHAFPTMQAARAAVETAEGVYWPQLLLRGFRIAPAVTEWETDA